MPTDPSTAPATATTRRRFLAGVGAGVVAGGALIGTGAVAVPLVAGVTAAGAQGTEGFDDATFANFAAPLEQAAAVVYQAALDSGRLDDDWTNGALDFQANHLTVVETLTALLPTTAPAPVAAQAFVKPISADIAKAKDQKAVLTALGDMENVLSATHLQALSSIDDPITAKVVAQVLTTEAQQATSLLRASGVDLAVLTPEEPTTDGALAPGDVTGAPPGTTTSGSTSGN